jgi:adenylate cyclase
MPDDQSITPKPVRMPSPWRIAMVRLEHAAFTTSRFIRKRWKELLLPILVALLPIFESATSDPNDPRQTDWSIMERLARLNFDYYLNENPRIPDPNWPVKIIDIDEKSLAEIGQWPWPRTTIATLIDKLTEAEVRVIVFDMVFAEPDRLTPSRILGQLVTADAAQVDRDALGNLLATMPDNDDVLAEAIKRSGKVVTGVAFPSGLIGPPATIPKRGGIRLWNMTAGEGEDRTADPGLYERIRNGTGMVSNLREIERAATGNGHFSMSSGVDGLVRRIPLIYGYLPSSPDGSLDHDKVLYFPSLTLEALRVGSGNRRTGIIAVLNHSDTPDFPVDLQMFRVGDLEIQVRPNGELPIYFAGHVKPENAPPGGPDDYAGHRYIPAADVLDGSVDPAQLKDRYVFIGTSAAGLLDLRSSPLDKLFAGVEFHVEALEQILQGKYIARSATMRSIEMLAAAGLALFAVVLLQILGPLFASVLIIGGAVAMYALSYRQFLTSLELIDPILPITSLTLAFLTAVAFSLWRTQSEKAELRGTFGLYLSPELVNELAEDPSRLTLGGEIRDMTILFSDIRGFTSISEQYDPQSLTKLINAFLTPMTGYVLERRGTIDKYMGDALMAFWNAPLDDPKHAENACLAALEMTAVLGPLNERLEREAKEAGRKFLPLNAGIGLNTGPCCVGNVGSEQRFAYSVLGDAVNLASRLEGQTKSYGMAMVIGEATRVEVPDFATIELDMIRVKGKLQPVTIYGLLGDRDFARDPGFLRLKGQVDELLVLYRAQKWDDAEAKLAEARATASDLSAKLPRGTNCDVLFDLYAERIEAYRADPPGKDWDGVFTATSK